MNFVEMKGGLGNQIFQYVFSKYLERKTGKCSVLHVEFFDYIKRVSGGTVREFDIDKFNTNYVTVSGALECNGAVDEEEFKANGRMVKTGEYFYRGYWQDKVFLEAVQDSVMLDLTLKEDYITEVMMRAIKEMNENESVSMHIRGTDYLQGENRNIFSGLDAEYYKKAVYCIREKCPRPLKIYVFTDDPAYAGSILAGMGEDAYDIMPVAKPYQDLWLMAQTKHHIIANSSYSYWGAAIGANRRSGITVAPDNWFVRMQRPDIYFDDWIVL
ncbi:MAG: alpha-1,2-fucosyltransferase [Lachnospiraceae bacterium]|nr:alpha-1,2-fucosyltransferase [Lachnospiraceae bacterium]